MYQGDQYKIPFTIKMGDTLVTPDIAEGVKIEIADVTREWPGEVEWDAENSRWLYPVSQEQSLSISGNYKSQVQVNFGGDPAVIITSEVTEETIGKSVILEEWDG